MILIIFMFLQYLIIDSLNDLRKMFGPFDSLGEDFEADYDVLNDKRDVLDVPEAMHVDCLAYFETGTFYLEEVHFFQNFPDRKIFTSK